MYNSNNPEKIESASKVILDNAQFIDEIFLVDVTEFTMKSNDIGTFIRGIVDFVEKATKKGIKITFDYFSSTEDNLASMSLNDDRYYSYHKSAPYGVTTGTKYREFILEKEKINQDIHSNEKWCIATYVACGDRDRASGVHLDNSLDISPIIIGEGYDGDCCSCRSKLDISDLITLIKEAGE